MEGENKVEAKDIVRMCGFLEKKGKMKLMNQWKKYWFVLEERLLLYYRSEIEYTNLSPCRGSLNMGLVSTVRPGSSSGPCIIHVITRTQVVQLRAKNRETQEEWLQALLLSMSLPLITKTIKPYKEKKKILVYGSSLDNISLNDKVKSKNYESEWTLTTKLDVRKRQMSGNYYGGSLDTAIWSKKFQPIRTPSPNIPKAKMLEKILGFSNESDLNKRCKNSRLSLCSEEEMRYVGNDEMESDVKCKVHDENRNHDLLYSIVDKKKKRMSKTLSDTELNKKPEPYGVDYNKGVKSPFDRIRHVFRMPKDKATKSKSEKGKGREPRKRRQSFLQKVFGRKDHDIRDSESEISDPLYDTIEFVPEQPRSVIPVVFQEEEKAPAVEEKVVFEEEKVEPYEEKVLSDEEKSHVSLPIEEPVEEEPPIYSQAQRPIIGSKSILPANAMSELRNRLKSRESTDKHDENDEEIQLSLRKTDKKEKAPALPPRRVSRPVSPWHDVPTNNAPVTNAKPSFFVHKAIVKFNDTNRHSELEVPETQVTDLDDNLKIDLTEPKENSREVKKSGGKQKKKNDDLSTLLEQLTKITVAPLAEPECTDDNYNSSSDSWNKSQVSDPDYDIPRPHKPLNITISQGKEVINSTEFMGRSDNLSDTSSSFRSMEPDSLEMAEKMVVQT